MKPIPKLLSKSKIMRGYQCLKSMYLTVHHKELETPVTPETQVRFDEGNAVGKVARKQFPGGVLVDNEPWDFFGSLKKTRELLAQKSEVIYEAAFEFNGCYARADILKYSKATQRWNVYEVKSSTKIKDEHLHDVALQAWIMAKGGLPVERIHIMHLNSQCRFPQLDDLFVTTDVTDKMRELYPLVQGKVTDIFKTIKGDSVPAIDIGPQCTKPYDCVFMDACWQEKAIPKVSVLNLPKLGDKKWDYYSQGIVELNDPRLNELAHEFTPMQQRILEATKSGKPYIDKDGIRKALDSWQFPLVFLDFETISPAIPRYDGTGPYQQVPFQFSVHIWNSPESELIHKEYLHQDQSDPRPHLVPKLLDACGESGSIIAYYSQFESTRIKEMAGASVVYGEKLNNLLTRIVDPLPLIRNCVYYKEFGCSFSLKDVAPAILGASQSYEGMIVADGSAAQRAFEEIIDESTTSQRRAELVQASLDYCRKDTFVMVQFVKWLYEQIKGL